MYIRSTIIMFSKQAEYAWDCQWFPLGNLVSLSLLLNVLLSFHVRLHSGFAHHGNDGWNVHGFQAKTPCYCWSCHGLANSGTPAHAANDRWRRTYPLLRLYGCPRPRRHLIQVTMLDKTRLISIWIVHPLPEVIRLTSDMRKAAKWALMAPPTGEKIHH